MKNRKKGKNKLDERQEQELLQIEHNGCWIAFIGLFAVLAIQSFAYGFKNYEAVAGEGIVFLCLGSYILISCIRHGIWDRKLSPTPKVNVVCSGIGGCICGIYYFIMSYRNYHALLGSVATGIFMLGFSFVTVYAALSLAALLYRKRVDKLENEEDGEVGENGRK